MLVVLMKIVEIIVYYKTTYSETKEELGDWLGNMGPIISV